jgi:hypothetical protein
MNNKTFVAVLAVMVTSSASHAQSLNTSGEAGRLRVAQLLSDAKSSASSLKSDLATLDFFAASIGGWQTHAAILDLYQEHITSIRSQAARLESARNNGSLWQQTAVDRIIPVMQEFASSAEAAIRTSNANQTILQSSDFKRYFKLNSDQAGEFASLIAAWVDYAKTRDDLERVPQKTVSNSGPARGR